MYRRERTYFLSILFIVFLSQDFVLSFISNYFSLDAAKNLRYIRELFFLSVLLIAVLKRNWPSQVGILLLAYLLVVMIYVLIGLFNSWNYVTLVRSAGVLLIPVILTIGGYYLLSNENDLKVFVQALIAFSLFSALFGFWEVRNTFFWTQIVEYGSYLSNVKGIVTGYEPWSFLPWNFFGYEGARRAAGLLAAPLAQGALMAFAVMLLLAKLKKYGLLFWIISLAIVSVGLLQTSTRGAILMLGVSVFAFLVLSIKERIINVKGISIIAVGIILAFDAVYFLWELTVNILDGSTIGHIRALSMNLESFGEILIVGHGIGSAGSIASQTGLTIEGGGEGAIFSIAFQIGAIGAAIFLWFYIYSIYRVLNIKDKTQSEEFRLLRISIGCFGIGVATSFIFSEHILTFSGMGFYWVILGGILKIIDNNKIIKVLEKNSLAHNKDNYKLLFES